MTEDTQTNLKFAQRWAFLPAAIKHRFTPTSVISLIVMTFSLGGAVAVYKASFEQSQESQKKDHELLVKQADLIGEQTKALNSTNQRLEHLDGTLEGLDARMANLEGWRNGNGVPIFSTKQQGRRAKH